MLKNLQWLPMDKNVAFQALTAGLQPNFAVSFLTTLNREATGQAGSDSGDPRGKHKSPAGHLGHLAWQNVNPSPPCHSCFLRLHLYILFITLQ